jgi:hypothetical protein
MEDVSAVEIKNDMRMSEETYEPQSDRSSEVEKETINNSTYKKAYKKNFSNKTGKCAICPPHGGENADPNYKRRNKKSWKNNKSKSKHKTVDM